MGRRAQRWQKALLPLFLLPMLVGCQPRPRVVISMRNGKQAEVKVELADTPAKRTLGLQYRTELADDQGMLFLFPAAAVQSFWMKNTPISLDIIFIGSDLKIVGIAGRATPFSTDSLSVPAPSQFVLEIKGGLSQRLGIAAGDSVRLEDISLEGIRE